MSDNEDSRISIQNDFEEGKVVLKIVRGEKRSPVGMVISSEDYERRLSTHQYQPLLFILNIRLRLAYLYGCLNHQYRAPKSETNIFMWRKIGCDEWREWFRIDPYEDSVYNEVDIVK